MGSYAAAVVVVVVVVHLFQLSEKVSSYETMRRRVVRSGAKLSTVKSVQVLGQPKTSRVVLFRFKFVEKKKFLFWPFRISQLYTLQSAHLSWPNPV